MLTEPLSTSVKPVPSTAARPTYSARFSREKNPVTMWMPRSARSRADADRCSRRPACVPLSRKARTVRTPPMLSSSWCCKAPVATRCSAYTGEERRRYQRTESTWTGMATSAASRNRQSRTASPPRVSTMVSAERVNSGIACRTDFAIMETSLVTRETRSPEPAASTRSSGSRSARSMNCSRTAAKTVSPSRATSALPTAVAAPRTSATATSSTSGTVSASEPRLSTTRSTMCPSRGAVSRPIPVPAARTTKAPAARSRWPRSMVRSAARLSAAEAVGRSTRSVLVGLMVSGVSSVSPGFAVCAGFCVSLAYADVMRAPPLGTPRRRRRVRRAGPRPRRCPRRGRSPGR